MKLNPALVNGLPPSESPAIAAAAKRADAQAARLGEAHAVWIRPNSETCFVIPDDDRLADCVQVYSTADGWL